VTSPLAEYGYYVYPVAVVDELMRQNGCPTPLDMHRVPLAKLREVFGADAVLYLTVKDWGTSYWFFDSVTSVEVEARLVDLSSEEPFWSKSASAAIHSSEGAQDPITPIFVALVYQVVSSSSDAAHELAPTVSGRLIADAHDGMLLGPRHPGFTAQQAKHREVAAAQAAPPPK
jgi:hypothetical protein